MEQGKFYQIKNITEHEYTLVGCDGSVIIRPIQYVDKSASAFTIQDAKAGDVISFNDGHGNDSIELIKSITDKKIEFWFCLTNGNRYEVFDGIIPYTNIISREGATPAAKEQREQIEKAMTDAGYWWNAEELKLEKIEHNPAWSEEDEFILKDAITAVDMMLTSEFQESNPNLYKSFEVAKHWLKSLKERYTWKPSENQMKALVCACVGKMLHLDDLNSLYDDLEKLK